MSAVDTVFDVVNAPDGVIAGGAFDPAAIVEAVRARSPNAKIIVNSSWFPPVALVRTGRVLIADVDK